MSLFLLVYFCDQFVAPKINSSQLTSLQCLSTLNMVFSDEDKILIKSLYLKGYTAESLIKECPEKSWTKVVLISCCKSCGTQAGQAARQRQTASEKKIDMPSYA